MVLPDFCSLLFYQQVLVLILLNPKTHFRTKLHFHAKA